MVIPINAPAVNVTYYHAFNAIKSNLDKYMTKIINQEKVSGVAKPDTIHRATLMTATASYVYLLWWYVNMSGSEEDIDYWKEELDYTEFKKCLARYDVNLDTITNAIFQITPTSSTTVIIGTPVSSGYPGPYPSDMVAGANGVAIGQAYELSADNIYGKKEGDITIRRM